MDYLSVEKALVWSRGIGSARSVKILDRLIAGHMRLAGRHAGDFGRDWPILVAGSSSVQADTGVGRPNPGAQQ
ncbi:MAG: hypothetical protein HN712_00180 [Gemmatimonadetes bacterium]|jgi:hypothetical protein|nr:hypothetical protein [Gemmatimonadota bacterium]MBT7858684.1 hypothetical protein [Gemmatimonadota bacterium]